MTKTEASADTLGREGRKFVRVQVRAEASLRVVGDPKESRFRATARNISRGGLCLHVERDQELLLAALGGKLPQIQISFDLFEREDPISASTKATWISSQLGWLKTPADPATPLLLGVRFTDLKLSDAEKINAFIADTLRSKRDTLFDRTKFELLSRISKRRGEPPR